MRSPRILEHGWGTLEIEGQVSLRDARLFPGGACAWDWRETGTHHQPGIQPADVLPLLEAGATAVVLSRGRHQRLGIMPETLALLQARGVEVCVAQTDEAIEAYNALARDGVPVGALIHSTC